MMLSALPPAPGVAFGKSTEKNFVLISIPCAQRVVTTDQSRMRRTFGLSPVQARLTSALMSGQTLKQSALQLGIAESTARQYLKVIFSKTGTRRQSELVRVIGNALTLNS
jgi:DNA-binding CsgD family transcriptional regulator